MWYFYVLQSQVKKDWFYKGSASDLRKRFSQHNNGEVFSTNFYRPLRLVYYEAYLTEKAARWREKLVKESGSVWIPLRNRIVNSLSN